MSKKGIMEKKIQKLPSIGYGLQSVYPYICTIFEKYPIEDIIFPKTDTSHELEKHTGTSLYLFSPLSCHSTLFNQFLQPILTLD